MKFEDIPDDIRRKPRIQKNGYLTLSIKGKKYYLHRLIMENYLGRKLKKYEQVHHINENKKDNRIENLEIINFKEHQRMHSLKNNFGKNRLGLEPTNKTKKEIQKEIINLRNKGYEYKEICKLVGVSRTTAYKYVKENSYGI